METIPAGWRLVVATLVKELDRLERVRPTVAFSGSETIAFTWYGPPGFQILVGPEASLLLDPQRECARGPQRVPLGLSPKGERYWMHEALRLAPRVPPCDRSAERAFVAALAAPTERGAEAMREAGISSGLRAGERARLVDLPVGTTFRRDGSSALWRLETRAYSEGAYHRVTLVDLEHNIHTGVDLLANVEITTVVSVPGQHRMRLDDAPIGSIVQLGSGIAGHDWSNAPRYLKGRIVASEPWGVEVEPIERSGDWAQYRNDVVNFAPASGWSCDLLEYPIGTRPKAAAAREVEADAQRALDREGLPYDRIPEGARVERADGSRPNVDWIRRPDGLLGPASLYAGDDARRHGHRYRIVPNRVGDLVPYGLIPMGAEVEYRIGQDVGRYQRVGRHGCAGLYCLSARVVANVADLFHPETTLPRNARYTIVALPT